MTELDYRVEDLVRELANKFRKTHDALDWSASVDDLIKLHGYDQDRYSRNPASSISTRLRPKVEQQGKRKVSALVSVTEKVILLSTDLHEAKEPFAKAHELGHAVLEWHREILYVCDEHDLTQRTRLQMEFEANTFAGEVLLPKELLAPYYTQFPVSMDTVLHIKQAAGASIEGTAYAYVRHHPGVCGVVVLEDILDENGIATGVRLKRKSLSKAAVATRKAGISLLGHNQEFGQDHRLYHAGRRLREVVETQITIGKERPCAASIFNNGYNTFCLLSPA